ncbi:MAG: hypothetical protein JRD03_02255 [Deltaproteobacteria bacterium]|nr:hypothetical protein [Deltaproteobacteria bacterium]
MSLIAELKRRNVFRVGAAYGIVAWVLIEVAHTAFPTLQLPNWTTTLVTVLLIMGFPVALVIAWAFELTPEGIKRETAVDPADSVRHATGRRLDFIIIGLLVLAVAYFAVDKFVLVSEPEQAGTTPEPLSVAESVAREKSIAVLPFVNMSSDPEQEYFSDGLSEEILNLLAKVPALKVTARTSSFAFKGKNEDVRSIGKALNVNAVLEGSVRKSGERVRITAQLIDVASGTHLWSETYDRILTDIFAVQDSVASEILDALQVHVGVAPTRGRPTENPEAYSLALKAKAALGVFDGKNARSYSLKAIELDPGYAQAHELLAFSYWYLGGGGMDPAEAQGLMFDAAAKALAIDPGLLFARALWEAGNKEDYSFHKEIQAFERVVGEDPSHAEATDALVYDLLYAGYFEEALAIAERLVELDPLSAPAHSELARAQISNGRTSEAIASFEIGAQLGLPFASYLLGDLYLLEEQDEVAIGVIESLMRKQGQPVEWVRELVVGARDPETGQAHLDRLLPQLGISVVGFSGVIYYSVFKYLDRFFERLFEIGIDGDEWNSAEVPIAFATIYRQSGFTAHPRYLEVAEAVGFFELWDERGAPDHCKKLAGQWACE